MGRRRFATMVAALALVLGLVVPATNSPAQGAQLFSCTAGGTLQVANTAVSFNGQGSCLGANGLFWPMTFSAHGSGSVALCVGGQAGVALIGLKTLTAIVQVQDPYGFFTNSYQQTWTQLVPNFLGAPVYSAVVQVTGGGGGVMNGLSLLSRQCPTPKVATTQGPFQLLFTAN